jgi:hypothetical protein
MQNLGKRTLQNVHYKTVQHTFLSIKCNYCNYAMDIRLMHVMRLTQIKKSLKIS